MMRLGKRGMTITELLVAISILSVSVVLMYGLIDNLQQKKKAVDVRADDLVVISDIEQYLQKKIMGIKEINYGRKTPKEISRKYEASNKKITITIKSILDNTYESVISLTGANNNEINFSQKKNGSAITGNTRKWVLQNQSCTIRDRSSSGKTVFIIIKCTSTKTNEIQYIRFPFYTKANVTRS